MVRNCTSLWPLVTAVLRCPVRRKRGRIASHALLIDLLAEFIQFCAQIFDVDFAAVEAGCHVTVLNNQVNRLFSEQHDQVEGRCKDLLLTDQVLGEHLFWSANVLANGVGEYIQVDILELLVGSAHYLRILRQQAFA